MRGLGLGGSLLGAWAALQVIAGFIAWAKTPASPWSMTLVAETLSFAVVGVGLLAGGYEARSRVLGVLFLVVASSFAFDPLNQAEVGPFWTALRADAWLAWTGWLFASMFPEVPETSATEKRIITTGLVLSAGAACSLWVVNLIPSGDLSTLFSRNDARSHYWTISYGLLLTSVGFIGLRARKAEGKERDKVKGLLKMSVGVTALLGTAIVAESTFATVHWFFEATFAGGALRKALQAVLLAFPAVAAYAVVADSVFAVRRAMPGSIRLRVSRLLLEAIVHLPWMWLVVQLVETRRMSLEEMGTSGAWVLLAAPVVTGLVLRTLRPSLLRRLERTFHIDASIYPGVLKSFSERIGEAKSLGEACSSISGFLTETLHTREATVYILSWERGTLSATRRGFASLSAHSSLLESLERTTRPLEVQRLHAMHTTSLTLEDRQWLADGDYALLAPLRNARKELLGCIGLTKRKSGLPFTLQELTLVEGVTAAAALAIELAMLRASQEETGAAFEPTTDAWVCGSCGRVAEIPGECACGGYREPAHLPLVLLGKFRFTHRLGQGAMGVVFRARDLNLDRDVAIKTLPQRSPEEASTLREEARMMARVEHPNIARIFGAETWRGKPLLVVELLEAGTLEDRLRKGRLSEAELGQLAKQVLSGLAHLHRNGILHRDIKPSNIARSTAGVWKLLDFGVAEIFSHGEDQAMGGLRGTLLYMPMEAMSGASPNPHFDLWSAAVVFVEAIVGTYPCRGQSLLPLAGEDPSVIRTALDEVSCSTPLRSVLMASLDPEPSRRPQSAEALLELWAPFS